MAKIYEFLADGFEDIEALAPVDILRRGGVEIKTVSVTDSLYVESAHGVTVKADLLFDEVEHFRDADMLMLPGGMPGAATLNRHDALRAILLLHSDSGRRIGAICAAPMVLGGLGILQGKRATCYPGFEKYLDCAEYTGELVTEDGKIITAKGPAASLPYAYKILSYFQGEDTVEEIKRGMMYEW